MNKIDLSKKIERLEAFEEKYAVRIENVSAWFDNDSGWISVLFELHPQVGTTLAKDIVVAIVAYNNKGQIIAKAEESYSAEEFWGFAVSDCFLAEISPQDISKIRIFPTTW